MNIDPNPGLSGGPAIRNAYEYEQQACAPGCSAGDTVHERGAVRIRAAPDPSRANGARVQIVCAEKVYGDVLAQIGGDAVEVFSILGQPNQDPHLFEADASVARRVAHAQLVVYN